MKITAQNLYKFGIIDEIISEPEEGAHEDIEFVAERMKKQLQKEIKHLMKQNKNQLIKTRYEKYRKMA